MMENKNILLVLPSETNPVDNDVKFFKDLGIGDMFFDISAIRERKVGRIRYIKTSCCNAVEESEVILKNGRTEKMERIYFTDYEGVCPTSKEHKKQTSIITLPVIQHPQIFAFIKRLQCCWLVSDVSFFELSFDTSFRAEVHNVQINYTQTENE